VSHAVERIWARDGLGARALLPLAWLYGVVTAVRNLAYDLGVFRSHALGLPSISIGNLTVGGTGKTPVASWVAQRLIARGLRPAIVLRGYGNDEPLVHARLTPGAVVVVDPTACAAPRPRARRGRRCWCSTMRSSTGAPGATWTSCSSQRSRAGRRACSPLAPPARGLGRCGARRRSW
jgi:hypothetical protein